MKGFIGKYCFPWDGIELGRSQMNANVFVIAPILMHEIESLKRVVFLRRFRIRFSKTCVRIRAGLPGLGDVLGPMGCDVFGSCASFPLDRRSTNEVA